MIRAFVALIFTLFMSLPVMAQNPVWVQVEAQPTLTSAQARVREYAGKLDNVAGFYLGSGWYGIVLGPYTSEDAETLLQSLRREGAVPRDSFVALGNNFQQQFWPIGVGAETNAQPLPQITGAVVNNEPFIVIPLPDTPAVDVPQDEAPVIAIPDETPAQARKSEAILSRPERESLQIALKWAGFYSSTIDGAFGRGTRASMGAWQDARNHESTGILTTAQRAELLGEYNAVLAGMDLVLIQDNATGIAIKIPTGAVAFSGYEPPFARFSANSDLEAQVLLISQTGDQARLFGLYEILQTLAIVPVDGPRSRGNNSFVLEGINGEIHSYTTATLSGGQIKGFSLIWPAGDEDRRNRVLSEMQASFATIEGVLDPATAQPDENQAIDLVSGLEVRKPILSRSGFYINRQGAVLTTSEAVQNCSRITIDESHEAKISYLDEARGLAVIKPDTTLAPIGVAAFQTAVPRLQSQVAVAGYPYGGILVSPSLTFGMLADLRGLDGGKAVKRLALTAQPGDAGGPVFDNGGAVLGMLLPKQDLNGQILPAEVSFAVDAEEILASLSAAGMTPDTTNTLAFMPPETLTLRAADVTVLVSCW